MRVEGCELKTGKEYETKIDINEIISKVGEFVNQIKDMSGNGKPMNVKVDSFNVSFGKMDGEYTLTFNSKLAIKPK